MVLVTTLALLASRQVTDEPGALATGKASWTESMTTETALVLWTVTWKVTSWPAVLAVSVSLKVPFWFASFCLSTVIDTGCWKVGWKQYCWLTVGSKSFVLIELSPLLEVKSPSLGTPVDPWRSYMFTQMRLGTLCSFG